MYTRISNVKLVSQLNNILSKFRAAQSQMAVTLNLLTEVNVYV